MVCPPLRLQIPRDLDFPNVRLLSFTLLELGASVRVQQPTVEMPILG
jgi:hypothetical protein